MSSPIAGIVFDLDGTLTRPGLINFAALRQEIGCPTGHDIITFLNQLSLRDPSAAARGWEVVEHHEHQALLATHPGEGLHDMVEALAAAHLPLAVLTRNSQRTLRATLERLGVAAAFQLGMGREDVAPKPDPAGVLHAARHFGLAPHSLLMVGDWRDDVTAGHRAGAWTAWLRGERTDPVPDHTDFLPTSLRDVVGIALGEPRSWAPPLKISQRPR